MTMLLAGQKIEDILKYPFQDKQWFSKLFLQGALLLLLSFFIVGLPFLMGFFICLIRRSIDGQSSLPNWSEWGSYWRRGLRALVVQFVYVAPLLVLWLVMVLLFVGSIILSDYREAMAGLAIVGVFFMFITYAVTFLYAMALSWFIQPAFLPLIALDVPLKNCWRLKSYIWPYIKANLGNIILSLLLGYLASMIASLGLFIFFIGYFFTMPYALAVLAHVNGLIYRASPIKYQS